MSKFQGFESFEVFASRGEVYVEQYSRDLKKLVTVQIPIQLWDQFVSDALNEIEISRRELEANDEQ